MEDLQHARGAGCRKGNIGAKILVRVMGLKSSIGFPVLRVLAGGGDSHMK